MAGDRGVRISRVFPLEAWDISFSMNVDVLSRFLSFLSEVNTDIPITFYRDRIVIRQKSSDSVSFTEIEIEVSDVMNYNPELPEGKNAKDSDHKLILIDGGELADEISSYAKGEDLIHIKIDMKKLKKVEFSCNEFKTWVPLLVIPDFVNKLDFTAKKIRENRNNLAFKGVSMILEPDSFTKICALGGKKKDIEIVLEASKKGLLVYTSSKDSGRSFTIDYEPDIVGDFNSSSLSDTYSNETNKLTGKIVGNDDGNDAGDSDSYDEFNDEDFSDREIDTSEFDSSDNEIINSNNETVNTISETLNENENSSEHIDTGIFNEDNVDTSWGIPIQKTTDKDNKSNKKIGSDKDKEEKEEKNSTRTNVRAAKSKFLSFEINGDKIITSTMKKEFICVLSKLKAQNPVLIEMRNNAPLIIEQNNSGMWKVMLTIAPIIEDENT